MSQNIFLLGVALIFFFFTDDGRVGLLSNTSQRFLMVLRSDFSVGQFMCENGALMLPESLTIAHWWMLVFSAWDVPSGAKIYSWEYHVIQVVSSRHSETRPTEAAHFKILASHAWKRRLYTWMHYFIHQSFYFDAPITPEQVIELMSRHYLLPLALSPTFILSNKSKPFKSLTGHTDKLFLRSHCLASMNLSSLLCVEILLLKPLLRQDVLWHAVSVFKKCICLV